MRQISIKSCLLFVAVAVSGCATIVEGTDQTVHVEIAPQTAICKLSQKGEVITTIGNGGGQVKVPKSKENIQVECTAPGYERQMVSLESSASGWGVVGCILIDLCITDYSTGALNKYQNSVKIRLAQALAGNPPQEGSTLVSAYASVPLSVAPSAGPQSYTPVTVMPPPSVSAAPPSSLKSYTTRHDDVQAYWGQDREKEFFPMPKAVPLYLVQTNAEWGLFEYTGNNGQRGRVWILMHEVQAGS